VHQTEGVQCLRADADDLNIYTGTSAQFFGKCIRTLTALPSSLTTSLSNHLLHNGIPYKFIFLTCVRLGVLSFHLACGIIYDLIFIWVFLAMILLSASGYSSHGVLFWFIKLIIGPINFPASSSPFKRSSCCE
jgi:hypothetical protein